VTYLTFWCICTLDLYSAGLWCSTRSCGFDESTKTSKRARNRAHQAAVLCGGWLWNLHPYHPKFQMQTPPDSRSLHNNMCHICMISNSDEVVKSPSAECYIVQSWLLFLISAMGDNSYFTSGDIHLSHFGYCYCEATWQDPAELLHTDRFEQVFHSLSALSFLFKYCYHKILIW